MRILQIVDRDGVRRVGIILDEYSIDLLVGEQTVYRLAQIAIGEQASLVELLRATKTAERVRYDEVVAEGRVLAPIDHPDPAHLLVTGTGLTHLGSADMRDRMHSGDLKDLTDSMKMFRLGVAGGKPQASQVGVQPEWFYKGDGSCIVPPYQALQSPAFALDHGEEPEIAGLYMIGPRGIPCRVGFSLGNEFSDHVTERQNYLYLAHSKLRPCAIGPELLLGELPSNIRGWSRIRRGTEVVWARPFSSGEDNMSHSIANLEHHHFKYVRFRRPGDVHVHFFGTSTLSFADGISPQEGDEFEIEAEGFGRSLRNRLEIEPDSPATIYAL